jgi:hypothetical protein
MSNCSWCATPLKGGKVTFCPVCQAPQTCFGYFLYGGNFLAKNLAIPLAIGLVTLILTERQQESALIVSNRQRLAEALGDVGKVQADNRLAYSQIDFMTVAKGDAVPAKDLKEAVLKLDLAISSFGAKLGPFEEFARRTNFYGSLSPSDPTPLQRAWDECFVKPYWGNNASPGYLSQIKNSVSTCDETKCPKAAAQELKKILDNFYSGLCDQGVPVKSVPQVWFNRELRRISIQQHNPGNVYDVGAH